MRAIVYTRASLDRSGDGLAVERQRADCAALASQRDWTVTETITDNDISASTSKPRPGYERMLDLVDAGQVDVIVCWHVDRLTRRLADLEDVIGRCERAGVKLATVSGDLDLSTDQGRLVGRILASVARGEVERKGARQRRANLQRAEAGHPPKWVHRRFGYETDMTVRPEEARAVVSACHMLLGGGTVSGVLREWRAMGVEPPQGSRWTRQSIRTILLNPRIAGLSTYEGEIVGQGSWEPLVPEQTWRAVRAALTDSSRAPERGVRTLLGGIAACPCDAIVLASSNHRGQRVYRCHPEHRTSDGPHVARQSDPVEAWLAGGTIDGEHVQGLIIERLSRPDAADLLTDDTRPDVEGLQSERLAVSSRLDSLATEWADGALTDSQIRTATERLRQRLSEIDGQIQRAGREDALIDLVTVDDVRACWASLDISRQRAVVRSLFEGIVLYPPGRGARRFDLESVEITWRQ